MPRWDSRRGRLANPSACPRHYMARVIHNHWKTVVCTTPRGAGGHLPQTNPVPLTVNFREPAGSFRLFSAAAPTSAQTALPR